MLFVLLLSCIVSMSLLDAMNSELTPKLSFVEKISLPEIEDALLLQEFIVDGNSYLVVISSHGKGIICTKKDTGWVRLFFCSTLSSARNCFYYKDTKGESLLVIQDRRWGSSYIRVFCITNLIVELLRLVDSSSETSPCCPSFNIMLSSHDSIYFGVHSLVQLLDGTLALRCDVTAMNSFVSCRSWYAISLEWDDIEKWHEIEGDEKKSDQTPKLLNMRLINHDPMTRRDDYLCRYEIGAQDALSVACFSHCSDTRPDGFMYLGQRKCVSVWRKHPIS